MDTQSRVTYRKRENEALAKAKKKAAVFREVFSTPHGRRVLVEILNDLHYHDCEVASEEVMILQRAARRLLAKMLIIHEDNIFNLVDAYLTVPMPHEKEQ